ncbi:MAG: exonuclease domain-containing protein [Parvibaculales bacterium]
MFELTDEQKQIIRIFRDDKSAKIHAFAGTGKTFTLGKIAEQTEKSGLYVAFNRAIADEAKTIMPKNVRVSTAHSLAFKWAITKYEIGKLIHNPNQKNLDEYLNNFKSSCKGATFEVSDYFIKQQILKILENFLNSDHSEVSLKNVSFEDASSFTKRYLNKFKSQLVEQTSSIWRLMQDPNQQLPLGHNGYLKLWALSQPKLDYEFLLVDEAQDFNPNMLSIVQNFDKQVILVGDSAQQIYAWRGAVDVMSMNLDYVELSLSKTFRFGTELAALVNPILQRLGCKNKLTSQAEQGTEVTIEKDKAGEADTFLCRKSVTLVEKAISLHLQGLTYFLNDPRGHVESTVCDYFRLNEGISGRSIIFQGYNNWVEIKRIVEAEDEHPFSAWVELFKNHDPSLIQEVVDGSEISADNANVTLSTIHQAKGLEWICVEISDDFRLDFQSALNDQTVLHDEEELKLLYVAMTRAKKRLILPDVISKFCREKVQNFQRYAMIDLETTGLSPDHGDRVTEIGIVILEKGLIVNQYESFINPERNIPADVVSITGITNDMVKNAPTFGSIADEILEFVAGCELVAHNASFERKFLEAEFQNSDIFYREKILCTMLLSRRINLDLKSHKLENLAKKYKVRQLSAHRALDDARVTAEVFAKMLSEQFDERIWTSDNKDILHKLISIAPKQIRADGLSFTLENLHPAPFNTQNRNTLIFADRNSMAKLTASRRLEQNEPARLAKEEQTNKYWRETVNERNASAKGVHWDSNKYADFSSKHFGLIYILKSKVGGLVKVGETTVNAESRLKSYAKAHDLEGFGIHSKYYVPRDKCQKIEKLTHKKLREFQVRIGTTKEIFECSPEVARQALFNAFVELDIDYEHFESAIKRKLNSLKIEREKKQRIEEEQRRLEQVEHEKKRKLSAYGRRSLFFGFGLFLLVLFGVIDSENLMVWFLIIGSVAVGLGLVDSS